jgi:hypothetical protein
MGTKRALLWKIFFLIPENGPIWTSLDKLFLTDGFHRVDDHNTIRPPVDGAVPCSFHTSRFTTMLTADGDIGHFDSSGRNCLFHLLDSNPEMPKGWL